MAKIDNRTALLASEVGKENKIGILGHKRANFQINAVENSEADKLGDLVT